MWPLTNFCHFIDIPVIKTKRSLGITIGKLYYKENKTNLINIMTKPIIFIIDISLIKDAPLITYSSIIRRIILNTYKINMQNCSKNAMIAISFYNLSHEINTYIIDLGDVISKDLIFLNSLKEVHSDFFKHDLVFFRVTMILYGLKIYSKF